MRHSLLAALAAATLLSGAASAATTMVYNSSGQADPSKGLDIVGSDSYFAQNYEVVHDFTLTAGATLKAFNFVGITANVMQPPAKATISIYANTGTGPSGNPIFTTAADQLPDVQYVSTVLLDQPFSEAVYTVSLPDWALDAGKYYIGVNVTLQKDFYWATINDAPNAGQDDWQKQLSRPGYDGHPQEDLFWLNGDVTATSPAPEPASWAMMLGGFGLVGGALRSSRRKTAVTFA